MKQKFLFISCSLVLFASQNIMQHASAQDYKSCLSDLRFRAEKQGISKETFDYALRGVQPDMSIMDLMNAQPEFKSPIWDYIGALVDDQRVEDGSKAIKRWSRALAQAEKNFSVNRYIIAGVWGVESDFGQSMGQRPLVQSLLTVSCFGRRQNYFRGEFVSTLRIVQRGDIHSSLLKGSWAGAFGHTQFMPSTYHRLAVDMDGDGKRDIVSSVPDALGSTANFLKKAGWNNSLPWGYEVRLPKSFKAELAGRKKKRPLKEWSSMGITHLNGTALSGNYSAGILIPAGINGPAFIVTKNFDALYSYNAAESYGLAIGLLADRLQGKQGIRTPWPTDDPPLSRAERRELQVLLLKRGYDIGEVDGKIGSKTREAIKDVERSLSMRPIGRAGGKVLKALKR